MIKLFLSHSSKDKDVIRHLADKLKEEGISFWLDEEEIEVGESITKKIQEGLKDATHIAVWLTNNSVNSEWVNIEWQTKIFHEIPKKQVCVLPLLGEPCDIPLFLTGIRYADFTKSFDDGFKYLLRMLNKQNATPKKEKNFGLSISDLTRQFLKDLDGAIIPFPTVGNLNIIRSLKSIPRSGKLLRLEGVKPYLPIRTIYDHILSTAHSADVLFQISDFGIHARDKLELARIIAYHDITEVILGDIPQYTKLNQKKRNRARVSAEIRLSQLPNGEPERITNEFIAMFLQESERQSLNAAASAMLSKSPVSNFAYVLDKIDPIISVWRYIHQYRDIDGFDIDDYLLKMKHFFENPKVRIVAKKYANDVKIVSLVDYLQNRNYAREYFLNEPPPQGELFPYPKEIVKNLIEGIKIEFTVKNSGERKRLSERETPSHPHNLPQKNNNQTSQIH